MVIGTDHRAVGLSSRSSREVCASWVPSCRCRKASARRRPRGTVPRNSRRLAALAAPPARLPGAARDGSGARAVSAPSLSNGRAGERLFVHPPRRNLRPDSDDRRTPTSRRVGWTRVVLCCLRFGRSRARTVTGGSRDMWSRSAASPARVAALTLPEAEPVADVRRVDSSAPTATEALLSRSQRAVRARASAVTAAVARRKATVISVSETMARSPPVQPQGVPVPGRLRRRADDPASGTRQQGRRSPACLNRYGRWFSGPYTPSAYPSRQACAYVRVAPRTHRRGPAVTTAGPLSIRVTSAPGRCARAQRPGWSSSP